MENERQTSVQTIRGTSKDSPISLHIQEYLEKNFMQQQDVLAVEEPEAIELEKNPAEQESINLANRLTNELLGEYGIDPLNIPEDNIHIVSTRLKNSESESNLGGYYIQQHQAIIILKSNMTTVFVHRLIHEMLHFKSFNSAVVKTNMNDDYLVSDFRIGLSFRTPLRPGSNILNEAMTEQLAIELFKRYQDTEPYKQDLENSKVAIANINSGEEKLGRQPIDESYIFATPDIFDETKAHISGFAYGPERKFLNELIDNIFAKNPDKFKTKKDVFKLFAKSYFTGHVYELAKLVDATFGKGKFKQISEGDNVEVLSELL